MDTNLAYQEETREELIGGQWIAMASPNVAHQLISGDIYRIFSAYLRGRRCMALPDGVTVYLSEEDQFIPDMSIVCDPDKLRTNGIYGPPDLVVEILSNKTARNDRGRKKDAYERSGVREYWIVDPARLTLEQYLLSDGRFRLIDIYHKYSAEELSDMDEDEKAAIIREFKCSLYDDLTIRVDEVFERVN